ncbi:MAG: Crp/Fnr family transcriptional regulator [Denitratisoma sp.]|nr:Crp/Fnr family transcriptional regulator [Denitratisoma sp.]
MISDWPVLAADHPELTHIPPALRDAARLRAFAAGETLFRQGDRPKAMYCVLDGEVRLLRHSRTGGEVVLQRSRGGFFAEASLESKAYHCDGVAAADGRLLAFPIREFREALEGDAAFRNDWMAQLAREVRRLRARCERLSLHGAEARILHAIESEGTAGTLVLAQSRKAWAAELGLTHEALYRTLARLQDEGTLAVDGPRLTLRQPGRRL